MKEILSWAKLALVTHYFVINFQGAAENMKCSYRQLSRATIDFFIQTHSWIFGCVSANFGHIFAISVNNYMTLIYRVVHLSWTWSKPLLHKPTGIWKKNYYKTSLLVSGHVQWHDWRSHNQMMAYFIVFKSNLIFFYTN